jgi:pyrroloquinoline-quinone synthase
MDLIQFQNELRERVAKYDLLKHPYYQAWTEGKLTREDLCFYAQQYYPFVASFPDYVAAVIEKRPESALQKVLHANLDDEINGSYSGGVPHSELWLDFAEGMGANRKAAKTSQIIPEVETLMSNFAQSAREGAPLASVAAFFAYETQIPQVAKEKARGLKELYQADDRTCEYFKVHSEEDAHHSAQWLSAMVAVAKTDEDRNLALASAEKAARWLWQALDGIEQRRTGGC